MKKFAATMTVMAMTLFSGNLHAAPAGSGAASGAESSSNFAWGIGLGAVAVLATMTGLIVSSSSKGPTTFSHS